MARVCAECLEPLTPVNECICDDDGPEDGSDEDDAA